MESSVANPDRTKRRKTTQGFQCDQAKKVATELRGMEAAKNHYISIGYKVEDKSYLRGIGYDYLCKNGKQIIEVEVKATTGGFGEVLITKNELENTYNSKNDTALFVVHGVEFEANNGQFVGVGGDFTIIENWQPKEAELTPLSYRYRITQ